MRKELSLIVTGLILAVLPVALVVHGKAVYNTAQCIASFEGQNSLVCRVGGSSTLRTAFLVLSVAGILTMSYGIVTYIRETKRK